MNSEYFNVEDILVENEVVPSTFSSDARNLGFLDDYGGSQDLKAGVRVNLPYWIGYVLADRQMIRLSLPKVYSAKMKSVLLSDALSVNFRDASLYYYDLGYKLAAISGDEELVDNLQTALSLRYQYILRKAAAAACALSTVAEPPPVRDKQVGANGSSSSADRNSSSRRHMVVESSSVGNAARTAETVAFTNKLARLELSLFDSRSKSMSAFKRWRKRQTHLVSPAVFLPTLRENSRGRKRKLE